MNNNPGLINKSVIPKKEEILPWGKYEVGDLVSEYQFIVKTPGSLPIVYDCEGSHFHFHAGTIFLDATTGIIWIENQFSLG